MFYVINSQEIFFYIFLLTFETETEKIGTRWDSNLHLSQARQVP